MPKRKRNRRNKKHNHIKKTPNNTFKMQKSPTSPPRTNSVQISLNNTTPVNRKKVIKRIKSVEDGYSFTNLNFLFNENDFNMSDHASLLDKNLSACNISIVSNDLKSYDKESCSPKISKKRIDEELCAILCETPKISKVCLLEKMCDGYLNPPLHASSPKYAAKDDTRINVQMEKCNNKEINLSMNKTKSTNLININNVGELNKKDLYDVCSNATQASSTRVLVENDQCQCQCNSNSNNAKGQQSQQFLHSINNKIIGKIRKFHNKYSSKWVQNIVSLCSWVCVMRPQQQVRNWGKPFFLLCKLRFKESNFNHESNCNKTTTTTSCNPCNIPEWEVKLKDVECRFSEQLLNQSNTIKLLKENQKKLEDEFQQFKKSAGAGGAPNPLFTPINPCQTAGPPPPPPPLPPLPIFYSTPFNPSELKKQNRDVYQTKSNSFSPRPAITTDDLRSVKLKKITVSFFLYINIYNFKSRISE